MAPANQFQKSALDFLGKAFRFRRNKDLLEAPAVPLVIRVAVAGHLEVPDRERVGSLIEAVLEDVATCAQGSATQFCRRLFGDKGPVAWKIRVVSQLAAGVDQLAAAAIRNMANRQIAIEHHVVLPGPRSRFRKTLEAYQGAGEGFDSFLTTAARVLELDCQSSSIENEDLAQAGDVILSHADFLLVAMHELADDHAGGTRWLVEQALELALPVIRIPMESEQPVTIEWSEDERRQKFEILPGSDTCQRLIDSALKVELTAPEGSNQALGWFGSGYVSQFDPGFNEKEYDRVLGHLNQLEPLQSALELVAQDLKAAKVWADCRASALAELTRGSFLWCMLLSFWAVAGAISGLIFPSMSTLGKASELIVLSVIAWFAGNAHRYSWRTHWLSTRVAERSLDHSAWLSVTGRGSKFRRAPYVHDRKRNRDSDWAAAYLKAVRRNASFPSAMFSPNYLSLAHKLVLTNLVQDQIRYYDGEIDFQRKAEEQLETCSRRMIQVAVLATAFSLLLSLQFGLVGIFGQQAPDPAPQWISAAGTLASALGCLMPAAAAAAAAIRFAGEYAQLARRFTDTRIALEEVRVSLDRHLPDSSPEGHPEVSSAYLARQVVAATAALKGEVQEWSSILRGKALEV